jgi:hypothetical protein
MLNQVKLHSVYRNPDDRFQLATDLRLDGP